MPLAKHPATGSYMRTSIRKPSRVGVKSVHAVDGSEQKKTTDRVEQLGASNRC